MREEGLERERRERERERERESERERETERDIQTLLHFDSFKLLFMTDQAYRSMIGL